MEIDHEYHKGKRFKGGRFLPFVIMDKPFEITSAWKEKNESYYIDFNDSKMSEKKPSGKKSAKDFIFLYSGIFSFFSIIIPGVQFIEGEPFGLFLNVVLFFIGLPFVILAYKSWKKFKYAPEYTYVSFDRENSLITMPKISEQEYFTIPFEHLKATKRAVGARYYYSGQQLHFFIEPRPWRPWRHFDYLVLSIQPYDPISKWSLYVWYMDKNRPLPPGCAFDEYRKDDFKRRKAEGFPPPLFKSRIPTPEANAEQQALRDNYWKDEEHMANEEEAFFSLWRKKPKAQNK